MTITSGGLPWVCSAHPLTFVRPTVVQCPSGRKPELLKTLLLIDLLGFALLPTPPREDKPHEHTTDDSDGVCLDLCAFHWRDPAAYQGRIPDRSSGSTPRCRLGPRGLACAGLYLQ